MKQRHDTRMLLLLLLLALLIDVTHSWALDCPATANFVAVLISRIPHKLTVASLLTAAGVHRSDSRGVPRGVASAVQSAQGRLQAPR